MYTHILVPVSPDHEGSGEAAISAAEVLLDDDGRITLLHVHEPIPAYGVAYVPQEVLVQNRSDVKTVLGDLARRTTASVDVALVDGRAGRSITEYADTHQVDCIVIASHRPEFSDYFLGSTAAWVARHADCSVHIIR